jgi:hypothetical protein
MISRGLFRHIKVGCIQFLARLFLFVMGNHRFIQCHNSLNSSDSVVKLTNKQGKDTTLYGVTIGFIFRKTKHI